MKKLITTALAIATIATTQLVPVADNGVFDTVSTAISVSAADYTPARVSNVKGKHITYNSATLMWDKVDNAKGYRIYVYDTAKKKYVKVTTITKNTTTSYKLTGLTAGTTYKYKVRAYRKVKGKNYWGKSSFALKLPTMSYAPAKVTGVKATANSKTAGTLTWKKIADAKGYRIYVYNTKTKKYVKVTTITDNSTTKYKITGLSAGTSYKYKVRAYKKVNGKTYWGKTSTAVTLTTKQDANATNLYNAYAAILRGDSTKAQRELIRQDLIAYTLKQEPSLILDETLYAFTDANGNPTDNWDNAVAFGNCGFDVGEMTDMEMSYWYMQGDTRINVPSRDECVKQVQRHFKEHIDDDISNYRKGLYSGNHFNIVLTYSYNSVVYDNCGLILPNYTMDFLYI